MKRERKARMTKERGINKTGNEIRDRAMTKRKGIIRNQTKRNKANK